MDYNDTNNMPVSLPLTVGRLNCCLRYITTKIRMDERILESYEMQGRDTEFIKWEIACGKYILGLISELPEKPNIKIVSK